LLEPDLGVVVWIKIEEIDRRMYFDSLSFFAVEVCIPPLLLATRGVLMAGNRFEHDGREQSLTVQSSAEDGEQKRLPFTERISCTIDEAREATGLGRTKLYELIGSGQLITTAIGRRRLVVVRSLLALLDPTMSA